MHTRPTRVAGTGKYSFSQPQVEASVGFLIFLKADLAFFDGGADHELSRGLCAVPATPRSS
ncbi:hypothetical protein RCH11_001447 [Glaciihabitans sp. GrIS 2.15]|nr:hypothetical protein [Glaciihabitans sp. GrIS 2.15]